MANKKLDGRRRDKTGRIDKKHGNTLVGSLRKTYGEILLPATAKT